MNVQRRFIIVLLTILILGTVGLAQVKKLNPMGKIVEKMPSLYLTVEKEKKSKPDQTVLRLHNNLRSAIQLHASDGEKGFDDLQLYYDLVDDKGEIIESYPCHVCSLVMLSGGRSIRFSIPLPALKRAYAMRLQFAYEWEVGDPVSASREPSHEVMLRLNDLKLGAVTDPTNPTPTMKPAKKAFDKKDRI